MYSSFKYKKFFILPIEFVKFYYNLIRILKGANVIRCVERPIIIIHFYYTFSSLHCVSHFIASTKNLKLINNNINPKL